MRRLAHLVPLVLVPGRFATTVATQEATSPIESVSPDPSECQITPRTLDPVLALAGHGWHFLWQPYPWMTRLSEAARPEGAFSRAARKQAAAAHSETRDDA